MNEKKFFLISIIIAILSTVVFLPSFRELVVVFGEAIIGRPLTHPVWDNRILMFEINFLIFLLTFLFAFFSYNHISCIAIRSFLNVFSCLIPVLLSLLLLYFAGISRDVWLDETFSLGLAHHKIKELISLTAMDVHPPLYYLILKSALQLMPNSIFFAKIISVIPIILILVASTLFLRKEFSCVHCILFDILFFSLYSVVHYAVEIRSYSWSLFFSTMCFILSYYIILKGEWKYWLLYIFFAELAAWCNYITGFGIAINYIYICLLSLEKNRKSFLKMLTSAFVGILLYLPWLLVLLHYSSSVKKSFSVGMAFSLKDFIHFILYIVPGSGFFFLFVIMVLFYLVFQLFSSLHKRRDVLSSFYLITFSTPYSLILFASIMSVFTKQFVPRYAFPFFIFIPMFIVMAFDDFKINRYLLALFISAGVVSSFGSFVDNYKFEKEMSIENERLETVMNENLTENTVFVYSQMVDHHIPHVVSSRWPKNKMYGYKLSPLWASAYFYDLENCIDDLSGQKDLCVVMNQKEAPDNKYTELDSDFFLVRFSHLPAVKLYFIKK